MLKRWRATRGFGVHSPLAFRIVKRVIRPKRDVIYYGEEQLASSPLPYSTVRRARLLLRLVAELQPSFVWTSPGLPEIYTEAIRLAGCVTRIYDGKVFPTEFSKADMVVSDNFKWKKSDLKKSMRPGTSILAFDVTPKFIGWITELLTGGVLLEGKRSLIAINTADPQPHIYKISPF